MQKLKNIVDIKPNSNPVQPSPSNLLLMSVDRNKVEYRSLCPKSWVCDKSKKEQFSTGKNLI